MTRIRLISDLHLESVPYPDSFVLPDQDFDVLAVAGDVYRSKPEEAARAVSRLATGRPAVMVMGNHEPWGLRIEDARDRLATACAQLGIQLLENGMTEIAGMRFVGGTLWSDGRLGDFVGDSNGGPTGEDIRIGPEGRPWTIVDAGAAHRETLTAIERAMEADDDRPLVVVTHHAPLPECLHQSVIGKPISGLLASNLSELVDSGRADLWLHGHVHHSVDIIRPSGTRVVCNPAGTAFSNLAFDDRMSISI